MLVVEVDVVDAQALQRAVAGLAHVGGAAVDRPARRVPRLDPYPELGGQEDFVAPAGYGAPNQFLVGVRPVHVGRVEEVAAEVERAVDRAQRFAFVG